MKKVFYKNIKISILLLAFLFLLQQTCFCDKGETVIDLDANSNTITESKQNKKEKYKLFHYYVNTKKYDNVILTGNSLLEYSLSKRKKYNVYYNLAQSYLALSKPEKALEVGQEAQFLYPKKIETKLLLGHIYKNNSLNELAIEKFKECLDIDSDNIEALINLGNIYNFQENYKLSLKYFETAQKEAEEDGKDLTVDEYINMAISAKEIGRTEQARKILENIKENNKKASLLLVDIYLNKYNYDRAIQILIPFVYKEDNIDIEIYCKLAELYLLSNKFDEAKDLLLYAKLKSNNAQNEAIDFLLIEAYHNIYHNKERELKELYKILSYTKSDYFKTILNKVISFEKAR